MNNIKFFDADIEAYVIASLLNDPTNWKNIPENWFREPISQKAYSELKKCLAPPYTTFPTIDILMSTVEDPETKLFLRELSHIKTDPRTAAFRKNELFEMYATRRVDEIIRRIPTSLSQKKIDTLVQETIREFAELQNPLLYGNRERGFIYDRAQDRWDYYKDIESDPTKREGIPFHINELDKHTRGGIRKPHIFLLYAATGGFKSRVKANLAYNFSFLGHQDVMVITLEIPNNDYERIIDSRHGLLDFNNIVAGDLGPDKDRYFDALSNIMVAKPSLYIVDIPDRSTSADVIAELNLYRAEFGKYPDIVVLDYVNEMEPVGEWQGTSDKYKTLGVELRRICRTHNIALITSMQENREGAKKKDKEKSGLENVGESHYFSNVCHLVIHLYQDEADVVENALHWSIKKNRYGPKDLSFITYANAALNYVGDRQLHIGDSV